MSARQELTALAAGLYGPRTVPGIGVVFNPRAGGNKRDPKAPQRLARQLGDLGQVATPYSIDELHRVAEDFLRQDIDVLAIAGGDGTNYVTLSGFRSVYRDKALPTVCFLRGGTMNTVASSLSLPKGKPDAILDLLVQRYMANPKLTTRSQGTLEVEGKVAFLWGLGVIPGYLREYYDTGTPSPLTAARTLVRAIGSAFVQGPMVQRMTKPIEVSVTTDTGEHWPMQSYFSVAGGTVPDIGLGFKPFHRCFERPGSFHLLGIHTSALGFIQDLPRIHGAQGMSPGKSTDAVVTSVTVQGRGPLQYMIDGDVSQCPRTEMTVRMGLTIELATLQ